MAVIKVNKEQWEAIGEEEQKKITEGLREVGSLQAHDTIEGDENTPVITDASMMEPLGIFDGLCKIACDVAAAAAATWCTANTAGIGLVACLAVASVAREECRKRC